MTKAELVEKVTGYKGLPELTKKNYQVIVDAVFESLKGAIKKDGRFSYPGFGTWSVKTRKARTGRNPRTGATIKIKPSKTVGFKPAPNFKDKL